MRYFLLLVFSLLFISSRAQKYALLDQRLAQPIAYADHVTQVDKFNGLFPVEKKFLPQFVRALQDISKKLSSDGPIGTAKQYQMGCTKFKGLTVSQATGDRLDYVITSTCDNLVVSMHLSDAKSSNATNAFFINTWIKYISNSEK